MWMSGYSHVGGGGGGSGSMYDGQREVASVQCYKKYNITPACVIEFFVKIAYNAATNRNTSRYTNSYSAVTFFQYDTVQYLSSYQVQPTIPRYRHHTGGWRTTT